MLFCIYRAVQYTCSMYSKRSIELPETCKAAVFEAPNRPMQFTQFALPQEMPPGAALCRIRLSTICGSDLHTTSGRRIEPAPSILGHESVGEVVALGEGAQYWNGEPLQLGDRVSWTIMASCGRCAFCGRGLPQKCVHLKKYGHMPMEVWPGLTGGYAEYIYLYPGTGIFAAPPVLEDAVVAPANCALATVVCAMETIGGVAPGESVLICGAGLLGTYLAALVKEAGARRVMVADADAVRAENTLRFGADAVFSTSVEPDAVAHWAREVCGGDGVDVAFEVCGDPCAASAALDALRIGGRLLVAGLVAPGSVFPLDGNQLTRRYLTVKGIHNYHPAHLGKGLEFLAATVGKYPYPSLVSPILDFDDIQHAFDLARQRVSARVALRCGGIA